MSVIATAVKHLMAAGVAGDDLLRAIAEMEAQVRAEPKPRSTGAIRQERYRRNKASHVTEVTECDAPSPSLDKEKSPTPPKEINPSPYPQNSDAIASVGPDEPVNDDDCENGDQLRPEHVAEFWNELANRLGKPKIRSLTPERRAAVRARIGGFTLDEFREVFGNVERSRFLSDGGFCTFDWLMKKANFQKVLEGNYNGEPVKKEYAGTANWRQH